MCINHNILSTPGALSLQVVQNQSAYYLIGHLGGLSFAYVMEWIESGSALTAHWYNSGLELKRWLYRMKFKCQY